MIYSLRELSLVDSPADKDFDRVTRMATQFLDAPVSLVSIVEKDNDRQFFKSACGLGEPWATTRQTPLSHSFCQHVVARNDPLVVSDARLDPLVKDNLAVPELNVIAYLGIPIHAPNGKPIGALCAIDGKPRDWTESQIATLTDLAALVTNQIASHSALLWSDKIQTNFARFGKIVERSQNEVFTFDPETYNFFDVNKGARDNLGYSLEEIQKLTPSDIKPLFSLEDFRELVAPLKRGDISQLNFETLHQRKDGSTYPVSIRLEYLDQTDRSVFIAFCENTTERMALEQALREKTEDFTALFNNAPDPVIVSDADTTILAANPAYEALVNCAKGELEGTKFVAHVPARYQKEMEASLKRATSENPFFTILQKQKINGKQRTLLWTHIQQFAGHRPAKIFSIANDVTELQKARIRAERKATEARRANEVRKVFLANMSHEVRTPLNAIIGLFQLIEAAQVPARQKKQAEVGLKASHHLLAQLVNVLEVSRMEADAVDIMIETTDIKHLAEQWREAALATNHRLGKNIKVSLLIEKDLTTFWQVDGRRITQIVNNLTDNALKFTETGQVQIKLDQLTTPSKSRPKVLSISVSDTGCGIPVAHHETIFERFAQVDGAETREKSGSGLGLAISRGLAELMGATLEVAPYATGGCFSTTFTLSLNAHSEVGPPREAPQKNLTC